MVETFDRLAQNIFVELVCVVGLWRSLFDTSDVEDKATGFLDFVQNAKREFTKLWIVGDVFDRV